MALSFGVKPSLSGAKKRFIALRHVMDEIGPNLVFLPLQGGGKGEELRRPRAEKGSWGRRGTLAGAACYPRDAAAFCSN